MRRPVVLSSIAALVVATHAATGQIVASTPQLIPYAPPLATTSFTPYLAFGSLAGTPINLALVGVNFDGNARLDGTVMFVATNKSAAYVNNPVALPSGSYSVQVVVSRVNQPAVLTIVRGSSTVLKSCSLVTSFTTTQACDSGAFTVADGNLSIGLQMSGGDQVTLAKVTVNRWK